MRDRVQIISRGNYLVVAVLMGFPREHVGESHLAKLTGELGTERDMVRGEGGRRQKERNIRRRSRSRSRRRREETATCVRS